MSDDNNNKSMDPAVFEQFLREMHSRLHEYEVDKKQTTDFFNEAIKQINEKYIPGNKMEYFSVPEPDVEESEDE
jgi:hypothetical protein